jgi:hypothetical protein
MNKSQRLGPIYAKKTMYLPVDPLCWCVGATGGMSWGRFWPKECFFSVRLALESLAFAWFVSGGLACGVGVLM